MTRLERAAMIAVRDCMFAQKGESVLIVTDEGKRNIGYALFNAARKLKCDSMILEMLPMKSHGAEPPKQVANLMKQFDVVMAPTSKSLSHTKARRAATKAGVRVATLPGILQATMSRALNADYKKIGALSEKLSEYLSKGAAARITTPAGTDITLSIKGRVGKADTGLVKTPEDFSNLPAGEAYIAPVEGSANGTLIIDGSLAELGLL
ncbi:MAG: aminopeptidase, partial [candidate division Zixibacteria bacterium]|nr:aminopeptidase [candidate division Zixibacteria bacterium]